MLGTTPAGWYPDPQGRALLRWWDGLWWTAWESDGVRDWSGAAPEPARALDADDLPALGMVRTVFLVQAQRRGALTPRQAQSLAQLTDDLAAEARTRSAEARPVGASQYPTPTARPAEPTDPTAPPPAQVPTPVPVPASPPMPAPVPQPQPQPRPPAPRPTPPPVPRPPSRLAQWWAASRLRLDTDLTVHGLTYLGVLLLFVGVFGLVAFAFGDVSPGLRPVAELAVAAVPFVAATLLARSGARFVARAMVAVGGLILPVMVVTSTVDGFGFPPDLHGAALPLGAGLACAALAGGYVALVGRRRDSALRVMWAPVAWFGAGMAAVGLGRPVPRGEDVAVPGAAQTAVIALALLATTLVAVRLLARSTPGSDRPRVALAAGALAAAPAGVVVTAVLALVAWFAEGWPLLPALTTTAALALAAAAAWPARAGAVLAGGWLVVVLRISTVDAATPLLSEHVPGTGAALDARPVLVVAALLAGLGLLEWLGRRQAPADAVPYGLVGWAAVVLTVVGVVAEPGGWWGIGGAVAVAVWAAARRVAAPSLPGAGVPLDVLTAVAPLAAIGGVWGELGGAAAGVLAAMTALGVTPLARGRLRRGPTDLFWPMWWGGLLVATVLGSVALGADGLLDAARPAERAVVPGMLALVVVALVLGPGGPVTTVALVTPVLWGLWGAVAVAAGLDAAVLVVGLAALGLGAVVAAHARPAPPGAALAVAGYATGLFAACAAPAAPQPAWPAAVALAALTCAWLTTAVAGDRGRSPVAGTLDAAGIGQLPWVLVLLGLPATAVAVLHAADAVPLGSAWWSAPLLLAALADGAATRRRTPDRLRAVLPWTAFALAVLAVVATVLPGLAGPPAAPGPDTWPAVVALATLVVVGPLVRDRHAVLVWTSWAAVAPLAGLATWNASAGARDLGSGALAAATLVGVGGVLVVGALLADRARPGRPRVVPGRAAMRPPYLVGAAELVVGTAAAAALGDRTTAGTLLAVVAGVLLAVAALTGIGSVGAAAAMFAWAAARVLTGSAYPGAWADLALAAGLLALALGASLRRPPDARWARWDVPLCVAAGLPAVVALGVATSAERPPVYVLTGGLAIATAVRLGRAARLRVTGETLATTGSLLVLLGAAWAGRAWVVAALLALAAGHTALAAVRESGAWRSARQWVGALLAGAAWLVVLDGRWVGAGEQVEADLTAVGGALVAVGVLAVVVAGRLHRSWALPWGSVATTLALMACLLPFVSDERAVPSSATLTAASGTEVGWWQVVAWVLLVGAAELAGRASEARATWRLVAVVPVLAALLTGLAVAATTALLRVMVLSLVSMAAAVVVLVQRRARPGPAAAEPPLMTLGVATLALAAGFALAGRAAGVVGAPAGQEVPGVVLVAAVLAVAAVEAAAYGVALRVLGLRVAAPVLAWVSWAFYAADAVGGVVAWYTVPVGLAMIAVVEVWRADRRERGLPPEPAVAALDVAGIGFLVVASFVAAFTTSVVHALVAAGIGVLVFGWSLLTRVRRRLLAGGAIVLAGVVVAVALPLVALVPAWGGAGMWVLVALVGLLVVLAATFLERGRAAVRGGRTRLLEATADWE